MKGLSEVIAEHPFFAGLSVEHRELIAGCGQIGAYKSGEFLLETGTPAEHFFIIRRGKVSLELAAPGQETFRFETLSAGQVVGWSWLFPPHVSHYDVRAVEDTGVVKFDGVCLRGKCEADPRLGYEVMKRFAQVLVQRFADTRLQLIDVYGSRDR